MVPAFNLPSRLTRTLATLPLATGLLMAGLCTFGCAPSPYYVDPDYTEHNRPRTVIIREPAQPPRAVLVRDYDRTPPPPPSDHKPDYRPDHKPPPEHRRPPDERREHRGDIRPPRDQQRQDSDSTPRRHRGQDTD